MRGIHQTMTATTTTTTTGDSVLVPLDYQGTTVRAVLVDGEPWLVLADLCKAVGVTDPEDAMRRLGDGVVRTLPVQDAVGGAQEATVVSESGTYRVVLRSGRPEALAFLSWVTDEALPSVRELGQGLPARTGEEGTQPGRWAHPTVSPRPGAPQATRRGTGRTPPGDQAQPTRPAPEAAGNSSTDVPGNSPGAAKGTGGAEVLPCAGKNPPTTTGVVPFAYEGAQVRVVTDTEGEPWFVAADIAKALGYRDATAFIRGVDDEDRGTRIVCTPSGDQEMTTISEPGLYTALVRSRAERAQPFRRWVTHEVLPSIRRNGGYLTPEATEAALTDPDFIIRLATSLKEERARRESLEARVAEDAPHARFGRAITRTDGDLLVKQVADLIHQAGGPRVTQNRLFQWLRDHGWLCRNPGRLWNAPTAWALDHGYVRQSVTAVTTSDGVKEKVTPRITAAGQEELINGFLTGRYDL